MTIGQQRSISKLLRFREHNQKAQTLQFWYECCADFIQEQSFVFEAVDDADKDRVIVAAEKRRGLPKTIAYKGMPQARKTISSVEESSKGFVYGYISNGRF